LGARGEDQLRTALEIEGESGGHGPLSPLRIGAYPSEHECDEHQQKDQRAQRAHASFWCCHSLLPCGRRPDTGLGSVLLVLFGVVPAMIHRRRGVSGHWPLTVGLGGRLGGLLRLLGCRYGLLGGSDGVGAVLCVAALLDVVRFVTVIE